MTAAAPPRTHRAELGVLTAAKVVSNTALRWVGPFLPTLERAFSTTTGTLTGIMGASELAGLSTIATGPMLDRGHERRVFVLGLCGVGVSSLVALIGTVTSFAVAFVLLVLGVGNLTVAGHTWIGLPLNTVKCACEVRIFFSDILFQYVCIAAYRFNFFQRCC